MIDESHGSAGKVNEQFMKKIKEESTMIEVKGIKFETLSQKSVNGSFNFRPG